MAADLATPVPHETVRPDGTVWTAAYPAGIDRPGWQWRHVDLVNPRGRAECEAETLWPAAIRRIVVGSDETPRIIADDEAIGGVLPSYARTGVHDEFTVISWHFAASRTRLLTARRHAARSLAAAYHLSQGTSAPPSGPVAMVLLALVDFCRSARSRIAVLGEELDAIEEQLLTAAGSGGSGRLAARIGQVRREAVEVRRALAPVARTLREAHDEWPAWALVEEHDAAEVAAEGVLDDITALNERARSLQDELTSRLAEETNRRLYLVSVVTTLVLPATFVTGFFGMNTGGFVWGETEPMGTLYAGLMCLFAVVAMVGLLRWWRLL